MCVAFHHSLKREMSFQTPLSNPPLHLVGLKRATSELMTCQGIGQPLDPSGSSRELVVSLKSIAVMQRRGNRTDLGE